MTAAIKLNGTPNVVTVAKGTVVTLTNTSNVGVLGWEWTLLDRPLGSLSMISNPFVAAPTITADKEGTHFIQLITYVDAARTIIDSVDRAVIRVPFTGKYDWVIPAAGETTEDDPIRGWATKVETLLIQIQEFLAGERDFKESVRATSGGVLPAYGRVGDVITASGNGALPAQDGVTLVVGDRLLLRHGASLVDNGVYDVTQVGDGLNPFILTRSEDMNKDAEVTAGSTFAVEEGSQPGSFYTLITPNPIVVNVSALNFAFIGGALSTSYTQTFVEGDLVGAGVLSVTHSLSANIAGVIVKDNNDEQVIPDDVTFVDGNNLDLILQSHRPLSGTWKLLVAA